MLKGVKIVRVPIDGLILNWLELEYPGRCDLTDLGSVGEFIGRLLSSSARA
ncbi:hypothetical protein [Bradyrhizobium sp. CCGUVB23]|uniref:hypothetical protein n=1 Tax=Bradyrhizobium sp. CCGUVB23 TaxID=2949630 RepID=UPI0020B23BE5|nr:hypothetical protein [Bradyrhizobium sp. CCGUVB23]MCP3460407.1 hypothetical protein [Bradyrhizobium sp. CCGUVB23]